MANLKKPLIIVEKNLAEIVEIVTITSTFITPADPESLVRGVLLNFDNVFFS